eukprot:1545664-Rhodomonas_salina.7
MPPATCLCYLPALAPFTTCPSRLSTLSASPCAKRCPVLVLTCSMRLESAGQPQPQPQPQPERGVHEGRVYASPMPCPVLTYSNPMPCPELTYANPMPWC